MAQQSRLGKTATYVRTENGTTFVRYHATDVVAFNGKRIVLNSGGWRTQTTKTRMNQASAQFELGYHVRQENGEWYVLRYPYQNVKRMKFTDGMAIRRIN